MQIYEENDLLEKIRKEVEEGSSKVILLVTISVIEHELILNKLSEIYLNKYVNLITLKYKSKMYNIAFKDNKRQLILINGLSEMPDYESYLRNIEQIAKENNKIVIASFYCSETRDILSRVFTDIGTKSHLIII